MAGHALIALVALAASAFAAWHDSRARRIPNLLTLPLLALGLFLHWPGSPAVWLTTAVLFIGWVNGLMGGGDAKLWMALLWLAPLDGSGTSTLVLWTTFLVTGAAQILWRKHKGERLTGVSAPAAWRSLPFAAWMVWMSLA